MPLQENNFEVDQELLAALETIPTPRTKAEQQANQLEQDIKVQNQKFEWLRSYITTQDLYYLIRPKIFASYELIGDDRKWLHSVADTLLEEIGSDFYDEYPLIDFNLSKDQIKKIFKEQRRTFKNFGDDNGLGKYLSHTDVSKSYWINGKNNMNYEKATPEINEYIKLVMMSVCGNKEENFDHFCHWLYWKLFNPTQTQALPAINVINKDGGAGKTLLVEYLLATMFTHDSIVNANLTKIAGFNKLLEGKHIAIFEESSQKKVDDEALKSILGSKNITIEPKGVDSYSVKNHLAFIFFTNDQAGSFKLGRDGAGSGINRRYSIIKTDTTLVQNCINNVNDIETDQQAIDLISDSIIPVLSSPEHAANFAKWLDQNYATKPMPRALHGEDFHSLFADTKTSIEIVCDYFMLFDVIPRSLIADTVIEYNKQTDTFSRQRSAIVTDINDYMTKHNIMVKSTKINGSGIMCCRFGGEQKRVAEMPVYNIVKDILL